MRSHEVVSRIIRSRQGVGDQVSVPILTVAANMTCFESHVIDSVALGEILSPYPVLVGKLRSAVRSSFL